ncbi:MAG: acetylxylan esterase [Planctomycetota bacterium]|nr:acetylxylan esterase [Planctomycetota bacterium]
MISSPENYGLSGEETLAKQTEALCPQNFEAFWADFREAVLTLPTHWQGSLDHETNQVIIASMRDIRVIAQVTMPPQTPVGVVLTTHGYEAPDIFEDDHEPWTEHGLVTVRLRVRGFPPSVMDMDDVRRDWILHGIESPEAWVLLGAVGDVVLAYRCARMAFGPDLPIAMHGESFGGGLAVLASAQLSALDDSPFRLVLGLPTFGDWAWRDGHYCNGSGGLVNQLLDIHRGDQREQLMQSLLLFDATLHAPAISCPALTKLAHIDDTVPAPSAASIHNALGSSHKWRFETKYGHFDGGLSDLRRHAQFERIHPGFLDPQFELEKWTESTKITFEL